MKEYCHSAMRAAALQSNAKCRDGGVVMVQLVFSPSLEKEITHADESPCRRRGSTD
jgi:hypothetical protein